MRWALFAVAAFALAGCSTPEPPRPPPFEDRTTEVRAPEEPLDPLMPLVDLPSAARASGTRLTFPYLDGEIEGASVSIGDTTHGRVVNARELTESSALQILPKQKERNLRYGTDNLVQLLEHAGDTLFSKTKTPLWVGNLGRREGGDIEWSVSHNAGRDADVAFCYRDAVTGKPADPSDLLQIHNDGMTKDKKLAFDTARTWIVVKSLIEFEGASLQYLFISDGLKKKLLEHARATHEPAAVIDRAAELLRQPGAAAAHDDHLHVRIYCSKMDAAGGCRDIGVVHPFAKRFEAEREKTADLARKQVSDPRPARRRTALLRLALVGDGNDVPLALARLEDASADVRVAAVELIAAVGTEEQTSKLVARFRDETDSAVLASIVEAIGFLGGKDAGPFFRDVLLATASREVLGFSPSSLPLDAASTPFFVGLADDPYPPMRALLAPTPAIDLAFDRAALQRLAVKAVRHTATVEPIAPLVDVLGDPDTSIALDAADSLAYLTNQQLFDESEKRPLRERLTEAKTRYGKLVTALGKSVRDSWLVNGFAAKGYKVRSLDRSSSWELLRAVADEPHVSYNARSILARLFGQPREVVHYGPGDGCRHLYHLLWDHRSELRLGSPSEAQRSACWRARSREKDSLALE